MVSGCRRCLKGCVHRDQNPEVCVDNLGGAGEGESTVGRSLGRGTEGAVGSLMRVCKCVYKGKVDVGQEWRLGPETGISHSGIATGTGIGIGVGTGHWESKGERLQPSGGGATDE